MPGIRSTPQNCLSGHPQGPAMPPPQIDHVQYEDGVEYMHIEDVAELESESPALPSSSSSYSLNYEAAMDEDPYASPPAYTESTEDPPSYWDRHLNPLLEQGPLYDTHGGYGAFDTPILDYTLLSMNPFDPEIDPEMHAFSAALQRSLQVSSPFEALQILYDAIRPWEEWRVVARDAANAGLERRMRRGE
ncbi:hypothetical protein BDV18DRAFT_163007 [Aspergillus unguis]